MRPFLLALPEDADLDQTCRLATALFKALPALNGALLAEMACVGVTFPPGDVVSVVSDEPEQGRHQPAQTSKSDQVQQHAVGGEPPRQPFDPKNTLEVRLTSIAGCGLPAGQFRQAPGQRGERGGDHEVISHVRKVHAQSRREDHGGDRDHRLIPRQLIESLKHCVVGLWIVSRQAAEQARQKVLKRPVKEVGGAA